MRGRSPWQRLCCASICYREYDPLPVPPYFSSCIVRATLDYLPSCYFSSGAPTNSFVSILSKKKVRRERKCHNSYATLGCHSVHFAVAECEDVLHSLRVPVQASLLVLSLVRFPTVSGDAQWLERVPALLGDGHCEHLSSSVVPQSRAVEGWHRHSHSGQQSLHLLLSSG